MSMTEQGLPESLPANDKIRTAGAGVRILVATLVW